MNKSQKTILVVEDEPSISQVCSKVLSEEGHRIDIATNSSIARKILDLQDYDLYLIDIMTPEMNGIELYQWLAETKPQQTSRIIFTGGYPYDREGSDILTGFDGQFLPKPFSPSELREVVREFFDETV